MTPLTLRELLMLQLYLKGKDGSRSVREDAALVKVESFILYLIEGMEQRRSTPEPYKPTPNTTANTDISF